MDNHDATERLAAEFVTYAARHPEEAGVAEQFAELLSDAEDPFVRARLAGHYTASAWLVDRSGQHLLMTHHRKLGMWLQLGGHADGDRDLAGVALREAEEESGLVDLSVEPEMYDLDRHWIPEHKGVPGHWHYDVRYVVRTRGSEEFVVSDESIALAWRPISDIAAGEGYDASLQRMARKWLESGESRVESRE